MKQSKKYFDRLRTSLKRKLPAGRQRRPNQGKKEHQNHQTKREEQPDRVCANQARLDGILFPWKHPGIIFAEIQRTCFTGGFATSSWRKSPMALLANCTLPANLRTTDFTECDDRLRVHA
jgi:hypothetical protein